MEHVSPGPKVMMALSSAATAHRQPEISGIACAAAVGQDCGALVGQGAVVGTTAGAAHPANMIITRIRVIPLAIIFLWFILFASFRFFEPAYILWFCG